MRQRVLIDAREFVHKRFTGIGRVLEGLTDALAESGNLEKITLAVTNSQMVPSRLKNRQKIFVETVPASFVRSEKSLSDLSRKNYSLFISPYPKLRLFGCHCRSINTVHDILDLTHAAYRKRLKVSFDQLRLKQALKKADLTWYVSSWSMNQTKSLVGFTGRNPRVRYSGINDSFNVGRKEKDIDVLRKYNLGSGYILVLGNGLPHKNLGVVLETSDRLSRRLVFVGVPKANRKMWKRLYPNAKTLWIKYASEEELPSIIKGAFCLAQPSTAEGYGYPPLEAMACGVPSVISNIPVLIETTNGHALSVDPCTPRDWIEAFEALEDKEIYMSRVEMGLKWVERFRGRKGGEGHISDIEGLVVR